MAEEVKNKIKYQGQEYDQEALDFLGQNAEAYARHQNLNDVQRNAFMQEVNARLASMRGGGDGASSDNNNIIYTGAFTGNQKNGPKAWNGITRNGFSARDAADSYLMGGFGRYNTLRSKQRATEQAAAEAEEASKIQAWTAHTGDGGSTLGSKLRRMWGNDLDMTHWADSSGDILVDGVRSREGRYRQLHDVLSAYRDELLSGKYGKVEDDEAKQNEIALLNGVLDNADVSQLDAAYGRLLGNDLYDRLMFTGEKYMTPEDITKAEQDSRLKQAQDYENGVEGIANPYAQGTPEYEALEMRRRHADDLRFNESFGNNANWQDGDSDYTYTATLTDAIDPSLFQGWQGNEMRVNLDTMYGRSYDEYGRDVREPGGAEFGHNDYTGWGQGDQSLEGTYYKGYIDQLRKTTDEAPDDILWKSGYNARSNNAIKAKAAMDWARALVSQPQYQQLQYDDGYVIPELIDWNTGKAYVFSFNGTQGRAKRVNLKTILSRIDKNSQLYKTLLNEYRIRNNRAAMQKEGGVLKAAQGAPLSPEEMQFLQSPQGQSQAYVDPFYNNEYRGFNGIQQSPEQRIANEDARYDEAQQNGVRKQDVIDRNNSTEFGARDYARIGTAIADLTGAIVSLSGFTPVGAAIGAGSTLTQFGLDIADHDVGFTDALKFLGAGLALDALTLLPGGGFAKIAKAAKSLSKYAVPIISALQVAGNSPEAIATAKKVFSGDFSSITVGEWKGFARALNGLTNATPMMHMAYSKRWGQLSKVKAPETITNYEFGVGGKKVSLNQQQIQAINNSENPSAALRAAFTGENALTEADDISQFMSKPGWLRSKFGAKSVLDTRSATGTSEVKDLAKIEAYVKQLRSIRNNRSRIIREGNRPDASLWARAKGTMTSYGLDDAAYAFGGSDPKNIFRLISGRPPVKNDGFLNTFKAASKELKDLRAAKSAEQAAAAQAQAQAQIEALDRMLTEGNLTPVDRAAIQQQRQNALDQLTNAKRDYRSLGGDAELSNSERAVNDLRKAIEDKRTLDSLTSEHTAAFNAFKASAKENQKLNKLVRQLTTKKSQNDAQIRQLRVDIGSTTNNVARRKMQAQLQVLREDNARIVGELKLAQANQTAKANELNSLRSASRSKEYAAQVARQQIDSLLSPHGLTADSDLAGAHKAKSDLFKQLRMLKRRSSTKTADINRILGDPNMLSNAADIKYADALTASGQTAIKDPAKFQAMLQDLANKGYTEDQIMQILQRQDLIDKVRAIYGFKRGGTIRKLYFGGATQSSNANPFIEGASKVGKFFGSNAISALELVKHADTIKQNKQTESLINNVPGLQLSYSPLNYTTSTGFVDLPYRNAANKVYSASNTASNNYAGAEQQLAGKLQGVKNSADYDVQGATALSQTLAQLQQKQQEIENANNRAINALNNQNAQLRNSKMLSDANNKATVLRNISNQNNILFQQMQSGIAQSNEANRLARIQQQIMDNPEYQQAYDEYNQALTAYRANPNDVTVKEEYNTAAKNLRRIKTDLTSQITAMNPQQPTSPFSYVRGITPYTGQFWDTKLLKEGGSIGKLTQAELVKLFRQKQRDKYHEKRDYMKQLDKYAERTQKGNVSPAYLHYLKLLNSKL